MKMKKLMIVCIAMVLAMAMGAGAASTISVSFDSNSTPIGMQTNDLAGAPMVRTTNWNNWAKDVAILGDDENVLNNSGSVVPGITMSISATGGWTSRDNNHGNDLEMFSDVIDVYNSGRTFTVSSIPYASYDVYAYMRDDGAARAGVFSIGTATNYARGGAGIPDIAGNGYVLSTDTTEGLGTDIDQGNYVVFSNLTSSSFQLYVNAVNGGDATMRNKFAGFQIVNTAPEGELTVDIAPAHGSTGVTTEPTITVTVTNGTLTVDTSAFKMALIASGATNDVTGDLVVATPASGVTTFSYTPPAPLDYGTEYTVAYDVAGIGGLTNHYFASFSTAVDLYFSTSPVDGDENVPTSSLVVVTVSNGVVSLNDVYIGQVMNVGSSSNVLVNMTHPSSGVSQFTYDPAGLDFDKVYDVEFKLFRSDGITNTIQFSFTSTYDPSKQLIAPGIRNGGFEYVNGGVSNTTKVTDFVQIDNWDLFAGGGKAGTVYDVNSPEGVRYLDTDRYVKVLNLTDHVIQEGDRFDFKWTTFGRPAGVIVGLCYSNAVDGVTNIAASEVTAPDGISTETVWSGSYAFGPGDPAIGSMLGLMIQDLGNNPTNDTSATEAHVDKVFLSFGTGPSIAPVIQLLGVDTGAGTASLMWDSESGVTYHVLSSPSLVSGSWATNLTVFGDGSTISTNVTISGAIQEFYQIKGE